MNDMKVTTTWIYQYCKIQDQFVITSFDQFIELGSILITTKA